MTPLSDRLRAAFDDPAMAFAADVSDHRIIPHIQLYEFETILLCEADHCSVPAVQQAENDRWGRTPGVRRDRDDPTPLPSFRPLVENVGIP